MAVLAILSPGVPTTTILTFASDGRGLSDAKGRGVGIHTRSLSSIAVKVALYS